MSWRQCPEPELADSTACNAVDAVLVSRSVDLGEMTVHRALPSGQNRMIGPFIFVDQMGPARFKSGEGIDVRPHPHINLATVTYLMEGEIRHRDSLGTDISIRPGAVNWMRAGKGIVHSERTSDALKTSGQYLLGLQTWVALPEALEESEPEFMHHGSDELPIAEEVGVTARLVAGEAFGLKSPLQTASATWYVDVELSQGNSVPVESHYDERALYLVAGEVEISGHRFESGRVLVFRSGDNPTVTALSNARFVLFGGAPMDGPRYIWWNFVSSRLERIEQAQADWSQGRFDRVPGDDTEFIPLPVDSTQPRRIAPR